MAEGHRSVNQLAAALDMLRHDGQQAIGEERLGQISDSAQLFAAVLAISATKVPYAMTRTPWGMGPGRSTGHFAPPLLLSVGLLTT
jgi:hypothetical protein